MSLVLFKVSYSSCEVVIVGHVGSDGFSRLCFWKHESEVIHSDLNVSSIGTENERIAFELVNITLLVH